MAILGNELYDELKGAKEMKDAVDVLNARIKELEAEHRDCLQTITDMQSKWEELKAENERLQGIIKRKDEFIDKVADAIAANIILDRQLGKAAIAAAMEGE